MGEVVLFQCSICERPPVGMTERKLVFSRTHGGGRIPISRMLKDIPRMELTIRVAGPDDDTLICDDCMRKLDLILDQISLRST